MHLLPILNTYDAVLLDQISADKVDEVLNLRLPPSVIIQEIVSALSSQSYISRKVVYAKPPTFAILNLIMQLPGYMVTQSKTSVQLVVLLWRGDEQNFSYVQTSAAVLA